MTTASEADPCSASMCVNTLSHFIPFHAPVKNVLLTGAQRVTELVSLLAQGHTVVPEHQV